MEEARVGVETLKRVSSEIRPLSETRPVGIAKRTTPPSHNGAPRTKPSPGMGAPAMFATSTRISAPALPPAHRQRIVSRVRVDKEGTSGCRQRHVALSSSSDAAAPSVNSRNEDPEGNLTGYPDKVRRIHLALDPYSRMAMPNRRGGEEVQKRPTSDIFWAFLGCFVTVAVLGLVDQYMHVTHGLPFMSGAWGTISVLAFGTVENPAARLYNCIVATVASAFIVATMVMLFGSCWWTRALSVATALGFMMWTGSVHPPGAAAIMGCMDQAAFQQLGYWYVLYPVLFGSLFVLFMGHLTQKLKTRYEFMLGGLFGDGWIKLRRAEDKDRNNERIEESMNECEGCTISYDEEDIVAQYEAFVEGAEGRLIEYTEVKKDRKGR